MKDIILKSLEGLLNWANSVGDFVNAELPLLAKEIVTYGVWSSFIGAVVALGISVVLFIGGQKTWKWAVSDEGETEVTIGAVFLWFGSIGAALAATGLSFEGIKALVAPRLFLVEKIMEMLK